MTDEALFQLLSDPAVEKRALSMLNYMRMMREAERRGEVSYAMACNIYGVSYPVLRSIKCLKRLAGRPGYINTQQLAEYMRGYKPKPRRAGIQHVTPTVLYTTPPIHLNAQ